MKDKDQGDIQFSKENVIYLPFLLSTQQWLKLCPGQRLLQLMSLISELLMGMKIIATFSSYCLGSISTLYHQAVPNRKC